MTTTCLLLGLLLLPSEELPPSREADLDLVARILKENDVSTTLPRPGVIAYFRDLVVSGWLLLAEGVRRLGLPASWQRWLTPGALAVAVTAGLLLLLLLARYVVRRIRAERAESQTAPVRVVPGGPVGPAPSRLARDRETWRAALLRRLADSDVKGALEALWWWLAFSLVGSRADPSWTSRELLDRAGRPDLLRLTHVLDRLRYGSRVPSVEEVRALLGRLAEVLA